MPSFPDSYNCWVCRNCTRPCYVVREANAVFRPERCIYEPRGGDAVANFVLLT